VTANLRLTVFHSSTKVAAPNGLAHPGPPGARPLGWKPFPRAFGATVSLPDWSSRGLVRLVKPGPCPIGQAGPCPIGQAGPCPIGQAGPCPIGQAGPLAISQAGA
jgi:hypothetical protein